MSDDLVKELRWYNSNSDASKKMHRAADRIEKLEAALWKCANQHHVIWLLAVKEQKGETTVSPYALAQITWSANEAARAALAGEKKDE